MIKGIYIPAQDHQSYLAPQSRKHIARSSTVNTRLKFTMTPIELPVASHLPPASSNGDTSKSRNASPLKKSGALDAAFAFEETTPSTGREYPSAQIVEEILNAPNADDLLRDLAITSTQFIGQLT